MTRGYRLLIGLCAVMLLTSPMFAADTQNRFALEGPGRISCATYNTLYAKPDAHLNILAGWTVGYLSAHQRLLEDTFDLTPWQTTGSIMGLLAQYCRANPDAPYETGIQALIIQMEPTRLTAESPLVKLEISDKAAVLYQDTLQHLRAALHQAGFHDIDSARTLSAALTAYQTQENLPVTGQPDQTTLAHLLAPNPK